MERAADPVKGDAGLFFFKGGAGKPFAGCNAGEGFAYMGAIRDSFPRNGGDAPLVLTDKADCQKPLRPWFHCSSRRS